MVDFKTRNLWLIPLVSLVLGCSTGPVGEFLSPNASAAPSQDNEVTIVARDVEAPEVFNVSAPGSWDGRATLGGVWVAYKGITDPERVIIRNTQNEQFVIGSLFPRDPADPSDGFQLSSEAASALGIPAGATQNLSVIALRPETPSTVDPATDIAPEPVAATPLDNAPEKPASSAPAPLALERDVAPVVAEVQTQPTPAAVASSLSKPFIQIGIFSVRANADRTAAEFNAAGIPTRVVEMKTDDKSFWRVVSGPAKSESERNSILARIKAKGFSDAYPVSS